MVSSPAQDKRWWARRDCRAFAGTCESNVNGHPIRVSSNKRTSTDQVLTLPVFNYLAHKDQIAVEDALSGRPPLNLSQWSQQMKVAEGKLDACIWFCGDIWDHTAPSVIVEEAGGRFSDHSGGSRLDSRTAIYSNGARHNKILESLKKFQPDGQLSLYISAPNF